MSVCSIVGVTRRCLSFAIVLMTIALSSASEASTRESTSTVVKPVAMDSASVPSAQGTTKSWLVSTRPSEQTFGQGCPAFCPRVHRIDHCGSLHTTGLAQLARSITPGVPVCIKVHGSFVSLDDVIQEAPLLHRWLQFASGGQPFHQIDFSWPSSYPLLPTIKCDSTYLGRRAARNGWYLAEFIRYIPPECPICLVGHSHGCRVISSALHLMAGGSVQGKEHPSSRATGRRIRVIFTAAAIKHDWLNPDERYERALCSAQCILNLRDRHDPALLVYPLRHPFSGRSLAITGFTEGDREELQSWSSKVVDYDVTHLIGYRHGWPRYLDHLQLAWSIRSYLFFSAD